MRIPIYREAATIPKGSSSDLPLYAYSFEPLGDLKPWDYIDAPDYAHLERGREAWEVEDGRVAPEDISDVRLVLPDGTKLQALAAFELFSDARGPELN
jgi:hypothetical protein